MAKNAVGILFLALLLACSVRLGKAAADGDCSSALSSLADCGPYVTAQSLAPTASCCTGVGNEIATEPICLCQLIEPGGAASVLPGFQSALATQLPTVCKLAGATSFHCNATMNGTSPTVAPTVAPSAPPASVGNIALALYIPRMLTCIATVVAMFHFPL